MPKFGASSATLITFNENSQVLPGNYPQEAYCQAGGWGGKEQDTNKTQQQ